MRLEPAVAGAKRKASSRDSLPRASRRRRRRLHATLGELVVAVVSVTPDPIEQVVVVEHILRTRGARLDRRRAKVGA